MNRFQPRRFGRYILAMPLKSSEERELFWARNSGRVEGGHIVVIKRLAQARGEDHPEFEAFAREAKVMASMRHANIIRLLDFDVVDGVPYIAMDHVHGLDLHKVAFPTRELARPIPMGMACAIIHKLCGAIDHVQNRTDNFGVSAEVLHRGVCPHHVMVSWDGEVTLLGFNGSNVLTYRGKRTHGFGMAGYMAPEQFGGEVVDRRAAVFSLGVLLHNILLGARAVPLHKVEERPDLVESVTAAVANLSHSALPGALQDIIRKAMALDPAVRFQSARAMEQELVAFMASVGPLPAMREVGAWLRGFDPGEYDRSRLRMEGLVDVEASPEVQVGPPSSWNVQ